MNEMDPSSLFALAMLDRISSELRSGRMVAARLSLEDESELKLSIVCVGVSRPIDVDDKPTALAVYRDPTPSDGCRVCGTHGMLRDTGDRSWLCLGCDHTFDPTKV